MSLILALVLAQSYNLNTPQPVRQGRNSFDGGVLWGVRATQGGGQDGGAWLTFDPRGTALASMLVSTGEVPGVLLAHQYGRNPIVSTATVPEDLWNGGGAYTGFPLNSDGGPTSQTLTVYSTSAADTADGGVGARTLHIHGLDINYAEISEIVSLNGATPVVTTQAFARLHEAIVLTAGSSDFNQGNIVVRHTTTAANVFCSMPTGTNETYVGGYTIPAGYTGYLNNFAIQMVEASGVLTSSQVAFWVREFGYAPRLVHPYDLNNNYAIDDYINGGLVLPAKTDIMPRVVSVTGNNIPFASHYDLFLLAD